MSAYVDQLRPWAIYQLMPNGQNEERCRLRSRSDADAYASVLRQGGGTFDVVFDGAKPKVPKDSSNNQAIAALNARSLID